MAKKRNNQPSQGAVPVHEIKGTGPVAKKFQFKKLEFKKLLPLFHLLIAFCLGFIVWMVFKECLDNQFVNWDDSGYLVNNPLVKDLSWQGIKAICLTQVMGNHHPLTILSYAIEYSFIQLDPKYYHADNLYIHILVTISVYWLALILTRRTSAAIITGLLFGLHPMHTESIAWIADRKDLLLSFFFISSCISWVYYKRFSGIKKALLFILVLIFFIGAILSKPVAVMLPLTFLLIDYLEDKVIKFKILYDKIPFLLISAVFGVISFKLQHDGGQMVYHHDSGILERFVLGSYALLTYFIKSVLPIDLKVFYPYPSKIKGALPYFYYFCPLVFAGLFYLTWKFWNRNKILVFSLLFFVVNLLPTLQFIPVGNAIVAERYAYLPYTGLFLLMGWLGSFFFEPVLNKKSLSIFLPVAFIYISWLGYNSYQRCNVWSDSKSLWMDEISKEPENAPVAWHNLGTVYFENWPDISDPGEKRADLDSAKFCLLKSIRIQHDMAGSYQVLGIIYEIEKNLDSSLFCFQTYMHINPSPEAHCDYGSILFEMGKNDSALAEFNTAINMQPDGSYLFYMNRGKLLMRLNQWNEALNDFNKAISINAGISEIYYQRSWCFSNLGAKELALKDIEKAISMGYPMVDENYYNELKKQVLTPDRPKPLF